MIPSSWAHNSSVLRHRHFLNRNTLSSNDSNQQRSLASFQLEYRDGPDSFIHHQQQQHLRYSGIEFLRPRSPPPPVVMRDSYYLESNTNMGSPSAMDTRTAEEKNADPAATRPKIHHGGVTYETTANGDVAVVQPSFDDHDGRSPGGDLVKASTDGETRSPPTKDQIPPPPLHHRGHRRNLSEHFQDATTLSSEPTVSTSSGAGQKHRRGFSGGLSNPAQAHRRIDSTGNSTAIKRGGPRDHRRIDSSGLDALTAAADFSREELAAAATGGRNNSWDPSGIRRSPIEVSYDQHGTVGPPPCHQPGMPHHCHYPPPPTGAYYGPTGPYVQPSYPPAYYGHPVGPAFGRLHPAPPLQDRYPVQHSRGQDHFMKEQTPLQQPILEKAREDSSALRASPTVTSSDHGLPMKEQMAPPSVASKDGMDPPAPPRWRTGGSTQGVQTYVTAIGVGSSSRTLEANPQVVPTASGPSEDARRHHRKLSSFSALAPLLFGDSGTGGDHPLKREAHHRSNSSVSFLDILDVQNTDAAFLRNLQASTGAPPAALNSKVALKADPAVSAIVAPKADPSTKLAAGGTSKRVRRKCTVGNCENRVVQGGLCIAHGAKRKQCRHPGCTKHVKKAGLCSTHGPARKRCDADGCTKVAVQGGRCIAHGAKKRSCSMEQCTKQAILGGMCKKHHDQSQQEGTPVMPRGPKGAVCQVVTTKKGAHSSKLSSGSAGSKKPGHHRGLSIFQEMTADSVGDILSGDGTPSGTAAPPSARPPTHAHRSTFSREFGSLY